jgi:hypothetical protein
MQTVEMDKIIIGLLVSAASGLSTVMTDFKNEGTPVTPQSFSLDVKFVWMTDFTLGSKTKIGANGGIMGWGLSVSETLSLKSEDKQTFTVEVKADLVPIAPPPAKSS